MLTDVHMSDTQCDEIIYSRKRITADLTKLGLLTGDDMGKVNLTLMELNTLDFDIDTN